MTGDEAHLFSGRIEELAELIERHVERGSLDEGNASVFDPIIEAWLQEELAGLDRHVAAGLREEADRLSAAQAEQETSRARAAAEEARASAERARAGALRDERRRLDEVAAEARIGRYADQVHATRRRLESSERQLDAATDLLLGTSFTAPVLRPVVRPVNQGTGYPRPPTVPGAVQGQVVEPGPSEGYLTDDDTDFGTGEHRTAEHRTAEHRTAEHRTAEHRTAEHRTGDPRIVRGA